MQRLKLAAVLLLTLLSALELAGHHHDLGQESRAHASSCAVCSFSADEAKSATPKMAVHLPLAWLLVASAETTAAAPTVAQSPARAPPQTS